MGEQREPAARAPSESAGTHLPTAISTLLRSVPAASHHRYAAVRVHGAVQPIGDTTARERAADARTHDPPSDSHVVLEPSGYLPSLLRRSLSDGGGPALLASPHVRLHAGLHAARAASAIGADAFALGRHIVFGANRLPPGDATRDPLVAHEAVHIQQQASARSITIDRKPSAPAPDPYRALSRRIDEESKQRYPGILGHLTTLLKLQELANAVEAKNLKAVSALVQQFVERDTEHPLDPASAVLLDDVPMVLVTRIFLLGLTAESAKLEQHFFRSRSFAYSQPVKDEGHGTRFAVLSSVVAELESSATFVDVASAEETIGRAAFVFGRLDADLAGIDVAGIRKKRDAARAAMYSGLSEPLAMRDTPGRTDNAFYSGVLGLMGTLTQMLQRAFQVIMDAAISEVESGGQKHDALKKAKSVLDSKIKPPLLSLHDRHFAQLTTRDVAPGALVPQLASLAVTRSDFEHRRKRHLDYFDRSKRSPSVDITAYDREETSFSEKELDVDRMLQIRSRQIALLERLAGVAVDEKTHQITAESRQDAALVASVKQFSLHGNDGWRQLLLAKFEAVKAEKKSDWEALLSTVDLLRSYLSAFTLHTPYNIDEFGDSYLSRTFPRAMTGQLIHDCGVYALRIAYMLSLVRERLRLTFRAAIMPVHVGLVISFGDDVSKGALYVNNNSIIPVDGKRLQEFAATWQSTDASGKALAKPAKLDVQALHGEIVAATFAEGVDLPVRFADVPRSPLGQKPTMNKAILWNWYHQINKTAVTQPVKGTPQPELLYLEYLRTLKEIHNTVRVPAYVQANRQFVADRAALEAASRNLTSTNAATRTLAMAVLQRHKALLEKIFEPLRAARAKAQAEADRLSAFMHSHPAAIGPAAKLRTAQRLSLSSDFKVDLYLGPVGGTGDLEAGQIIPGGWADATMLPGRSD